MKYKLLAASVLATLSTSALSATYQLTELGDFEAAKHTYVTDVSESGHVIGVANGLYNLPIDISYIDFTESSINSAYDAEVARFKEIDKEITFTLDDIENNDAIYTNADAHTFMVRFLSNLSSNFEYQKISSIIATNYNSGVITEQPLFDIASVDYDGLTRSTSNFYNGVAEDGTTVGWGSAPFDKVSFTPDGETEEETWFTRDFIERGILISADGVEVPFVPEFTEHGGTSKASDIVATDTGYIVVGNVSVSIPAERQTTITDNCDGLDEPVMACIESLNSRSTRGLFNKTAVKWTLDSAYNVTSTELLGLALTPEEDEDTNPFISNALAVNKNDVAVGFSNTRYFDRDSTILTMPTYFKDGEVVDFINQQDDWQAGKAFAINDNDIVVGYASKGIEGSLIAKFFHHNINTNTTVFPEDYFTSSNSYANDINNQGYIVGEGEVGDTASTRRSEAFLYKIGDDKITNLNSLLPCFDSDGETSFSYKMVEAKSINENNEVFGVATKTVEKLNSRGEVVTDINGNIQYESVAVAVKLSPIANGEVENCKAPDTEFYERSSASFSWFGLLLLPLVGLRRVFRF
ncbi:DUF3466 family protein [Pseudoalteromonas sp. Scap03]|uniref:DUF3466 family protein n=1 Tax=unclassified Pseudoalteromonas TaxID=194690 RepID=UPI0015B8EE5C|nr:MULTISPECIES: DUF3466 family protein [unclassified Pseudoalteromonas]NWL16437.1 DUF3466 family protein [Pseudoalteromonas sp. Scap03]QLE81553.1 DUF3466 family protein [Pseudoalteromonas sp. Scap25]QLE89497.1 DUF3466 family protein [Pseudoalteromonas sp. Scap06]